MSCWLACTVLVSIALLQKMVGDPSGQGEEQAFELFLSNPTSAGAHGDRASPRPGRDDLETSAMQGAGARGELGDDAAVTTLQHVARLRRIHVHAPLPWSVTQLRFLRRYPRGYSLHHAAGVDDSSYSAVVARYVREGCESAGAESTIYRCRS